MRTKLLCKRAMLGAAGLFFSPAPAWAQADTESVDWSRLVGFEGSDTTNPYYWPPNPAINWVGSVTSQADPVMNADIARASFGVTGAGVKIGVISDSFDVLGGASAGIASGDLPGLGNANGFVTPVTVVKDDVAGTDEGRGMIELIHDLAPGAEILFHSAFNNPGPAGAAPSTTIANAIDALRVAGADIIVDDVGILTSAKYQDGAAARAVNDAFAAGVAYFSSAGNNADNAQQQTFSSSGPVIGFNDLHAFDGATDQILDLGVIQPGQTFRATLRWADPYASLGGTPTTDLSLSIIDITNLSAVVFDQDQLAGADPFEFATFINDTGVPIEAGLIIDRVAGDPAKLVSVEVFGQDIADDDDTNSPTIHGHNAAEGALAVAAQFYADAGLDEVEAFSALGPTLILFDEDGNPLDTPEVRATPDLTGVDGTDTSFFPAGLATDVESNGFPNFFGTSAAAPHVAAVAALTLERAADLGLTLTPAELRDVLLASTVDIESPGFDNLSGFGRLDAQLAIAQVPEPAAATLLGLGAVAMLRRR
ncbi:MAG: S8 family serine peptidase [Planctomycetota bacterium]